MTSERLIGRDTFRFHTRSEITDEIAAQIRKVPGVEEAKVGRYRFDIEKAPAFSWNEVLDRLELLVGEPNEPNDSAPELIQSQHSEEIQ